MIWVLVFVLAVAGFWLLKFAIFGGRKKNPAPGSVGQQEWPSETFNEERLELALSKPPPENDAWETGIIKGSADGFELTSRAQITYVDRNGLLTKRQVSISHYYHDQAAVLGFCHLREANRTFIIGQIAEYVDLGTGEIVSDIPGHLERLYSQSPRGLAEAALEHVRDDYLVLLYVGRAGGSLSARRKQVIANYVLQAFPQADLAAIGDLVGREAASQHQFRDALKRLAMAPDTGQLIATVRALQGKPPNDFVGAAISVVEKRLKPGG